jgi:hypothetical protein
VEFTLFIPLTHKKLRILFTNLKIALLSGIGSKAAALGRDMFNKSYAERTVLLILKDMFYSFKVQRIFGIWQIA